MCLFDALFWCMACCAAVLFGVHVLICQRPVPWLLWVACALAISLQQREVETRDTVSASRKGASDLS